MGAPGGFGQPPGNPAAQAGFGGPVGQPSGQPGGFGGQIGGAMAAAGAPNPLAPNFGMAGGAGMKPQIRNPIVTFIMLMIPIYGLIVFYGMLKELKDYTQDPDFFLFGWLIPCYGPIWWLFKVPEQVTKAKQMAGSQKPARSILLYWLLGGYALAADLNEVADPNWQG
jgi:hypothetical protein